jgi:2-methylcitrate dehydratase PrpD
VHRLWEPLADKHRPPSGYAAKFSMPFCMAVGFYDGDAGLAQFSDEKAQEARVLALCAKISYEIDPANEYPHNYSGHIRVQTHDGRLIALDQPHMRGGMREPLTDGEIHTKAMANCEYGGWPSARGQELLDWIADLPKQGDLSGLAKFGA